VAPSSERLETSAQVARMKSEDGDALLREPAPLDGSLSPNVTREDHVACMRGDSALCLRIAGRLEPGPAVHYTLQACYLGLTAGCEATCRIDPSECD
jgi:hypothetical protein